MPCDDITEYVEVTLNPEEQLQSYSLTKGTCGSSVGSEGLLAEHVTGLPVAEIISSDSQRFDKLFETRIKSRQFLYYKHLFALKAVLRAYSGHESGGANDYCNLIGITHDIDSIVIKAWIKIDGLTEDIKSCGKACGRAPTRGSLGSPR